MFKINTVFLIISIASWACTTLEAYSTVPIRTTDTSSKKIVLLGDTQRTLWVEFWREQNDDARIKILDAVQKEKPTCILHCGDVVSWGASENSWLYATKLFAPLQAENIPLYVAFGNHDYMGNNDDCLRLLRSSIQAMNANTSTWYSVIHDSTAYIFLDSNSDELTNEQILEQDKWLAQKLREIEKRFDIRCAIVIWHHPAMTNSTTVSDNVFASSHFLDVVTRCPKVVLIANGHAHTYEHFRYNNTDIVTTGGGGGPRQDVLTSENQRHLDIYTGNRSFHYCLVKRIGSSLIVTVKMLDKETESIWSTADSWQTNK